MSHRRKRNLSAKRPEPRDLAEAIARNPHFQKWCKNRSGEIRFMTRTMLCWAAAVSLFQVIDPWTNRFTDKVPFLGFGVLCSGLWIVHRRYLP